MESDETLIERWRARGDERAFDALVARHQGPVYRLAFRMCGNHHDAHDIAQESFVRVFRGIDRFRGDATFRTWLYRIVMNVSLNHAQRGGIWRRTEEIDPDSLTAEPSALRSVLEAEERRELEDAIARLPPRQKETLVLKVFHELKYTEIARVMRCSVGTAKANFFHAVQRLRRELAMGATQAR